jgi:uncharacterized membrane protein YgcG
MNHRQITVVLLLVLLGIGLSVTPTFAQTKTFEWTVWNVDIHLLENGDMEVTETQTLEFSGAPFTFGFRTIPTGKAGNNDGISNVSVREGDQVYSESSSRAPGTFRVTDSGDETTIDWYFEPTLGRHTYTFSYIVHGGVRTGTLDEGSGDQIYWAVIPSDHPATVQSSQTTIQLPEGIQPQQFTGTEDYLVAAYLNGVESDDVQITVSEDGRNIIYEALRPILTGEQLDVRVQFPHGPLPIETPQWQEQEQRADVIGLIVLAVSALLLVAGPLLVLALWYTRGRDPELGVTVPDYLSEPPDELRPAVVGALIDEKVDMQDIISTLVDLAHRGYLTMTEEKKSHTFTRTEKEGGLRPFEQRFLKDIFGDKQERTLDSLRYKFANKLPQLRNLLYDELVDEGLVARSPQSVRNSYMAVGVLVLLAGFGAAFALGVLLSGAVELACFPAIGIAATGLALLFAARHMPSKTAKGAEAAAKWQSFKNYLKNIEDYTDLEQAADVFEKYLAYAIAFGLERTWISKFASLPTTPIPGWYVPYPVPGGYGTWPRPMGGVGSPPITTGTGSGGSGGPRPSLEGLSGGLTGGLAAMSVGLTRMLNSTSTVLKSTPPSTSSSSGGSFGGGFSSGGFSGGFSGGSSGGGGSSGFG